MKNKLILSILINFAIISFSFAQYSKIIRNASTTASMRDIQVRAKALIQSSAASDTLTIPGGPGNAGLLESTINSDTTKGIGRNNPNRVYKLTKNTIYIQHAGINVNNSTGTLIIVGEKGGRKPVIV